MKLETCYIILSIFLPLVWITLVKSSSIPHAVETETHIEEDVTNSEGLLLPATTESSKLNSYVKTKSAWMKNNKKPLYFQKASQQKFLKTSNERVNQGESKDFQKKQTTNPDMSGSEANFLVPSVTVNKTKEMLTCANDDLEMQQVCENFCTQVKKFNLGFCSSDQQTCICAMEGDDMTTLRVKLYKPKQKQVPLTEQNLTLKASPEDIVSREDFSCDHSEYSEKVCSAYCYQFKRLNHSKCSEDGNSCLCFSNETLLDQTENIKDEGGSRSARHFMPDDDDSEVFLGMKTPVSTKSRDGIPISVKGRAPLVPLPLAPLLPLPMSEPLVAAVYGCSTYSCMDVCPVYCQSMCMHSVDCYCSCPEDVFYEYEDYFSLW